MTRATDGLNDVVGVLTERRESNRRDVGENPPQPVLDATSIPIFRALAGYRCPSHPLDLLGARVAMETVG